MHKIALIEDDENLGYILKEYLQLNDYEVAWLDTAEKALNDVLRFQYDLMIIDVNLPDYDGFELADKLTQAGCSTPFLFLTARRLKTDKLRGFKLGGEDFIVKPVDEEELLARIHVVLRRSRPQKTSEQEAQITIGDVTFSYERLELFISGKSINLTEMEAELFKTLCTHPGQLISRRDIMLKIWKEDNYFTRRSMDVFISRLRKMLADSNEIVIKTVHGRGYLLEAKT